MFNYTKGIEQLTELYFYETEKPKNIHEPGDDPHSMLVHDGWSRAESFSPDREGFALHSFQTSHSDWTDDTAVKASFYPEIVSLLQKTTGAKRVLVFDHTIRTNANADRKLTDEKQISQRTPVMLVHCDYTAQPGPTRVKQLLPEEAEILLESRVAFINVWKPPNTVEESPLGMLDTTSTTPDIWQAKRGNAPLFSAAAAPLLLTSPTHMSYADLLLFNNDHNV